MLIMFWENVLKFWNPVTEACSGMDARCCFEIFTSKTYRTPVDLPGI